MKKMEFLNLQLVQAYLYRFWIRSVAFYLCCVWRPGPQKLQRRMRQSKFLSRALEYGVIITVTILLYFFCQWSFFEITSKFGVQNPDQLVRKNELDPHDEARNLTEAEEFFFGMKGCLPMPKFTQMTFNTPDSRFVHMILDGPQWEPRTGNPLTHVRIVFYLLGEDSRIKYSASKLERKKVLLDRQ